MRSVKASQESCHLRSWHQPRPHGKGLASNVSSISAARRYLALPRSERGVTCKASLSSQFLKGTFISNSSYWEDITTFLGFLPWITFLGVFYKSHTDVLCRQVMRLLEARVTHSQPLRAGLRWLSSLFLCNYIMVCVRGWGFSRFLTAVFMRQWQVFPLNHWMFFCFKDNWDLSCCDSRGNSPRSQRERHVGESHTLQHRQDPLVSVSDLTVSRFGRMDFISSLRELTHMQLGLLLPINVFLLKKKPCLS